MGEGEEKDIGMREKHQPIPSHTCPDWELNLQLRYVPWPRIGPATFLVNRMTLQPTVTPGWTDLNLLKNILIIRMHLTGFLSNGHLISA